jgi:hypothetical protein
MDQSFVKPEPAIKEEIKEGGSNLSFLGVEYCEHKYE